VADVLDRFNSALSDRYAIECEFGAGGMATVFLTEHLKHHRLVAIKVLCPELDATFGIASSWRGMFVWNSQRN